MKFSWKYTVVGVIVLLACLFGLVIAVGDNSSSNSAPSNVQPSNAVDAAFTL